MSNSTQELGTDDKPDDPQLAGRVVCPEEPTPWDIFMYQFGTIVYDWNIKPEAAKQIEELARSLYMDHPPTVYRECTVDCAKHHPKCDGFCDHTEDHRNLCWETYVD